MQPDYDLEEFARESEDRLVAAKRAQETAAAPALSEDDEIEMALDHASSEIRMASRPLVGDFLGLEAWAREASGGLTVTMRNAELVNLPLDHRAGFLLSLMDGAIDLETLVEIASMDRETVLRIVHDLWESGVVAFR